MKKRIVTFVLALMMAMVPAATMTACQEWVAAIGLPIRQADPTDEPSAQTDPDGEPSAHQTGPFGWLPTADVPATYQVDPVETIPDPDPDPGSSGDITLISDEHISYIKGGGSGQFSPGSSITRAEAAVIFYRLMSGTVPVTVSYTDVPAGSWYDEAAGQLGSLGILRVGEQTFLGGEPITRGEFVHCIAAFFPPRTDAEQFSDIPSTHRYARDILSCRAYGWLNGYGDGTFRAEQPISRSEAVAGINRSLGRTGDHEEIAENRPALFLDVPVTAWYYYDVMEATVPHTFDTAGNGAETWTSFTQADTGLPGDFRTEGSHLYQGWSYYYSADTQDILRSCTNAGFTYNADGHFTTGDAWVDEQLRGIILSQTNSGQTRDEMLRAFFAYCRDNYRYLKWTIYSTGDTSFTLDAARQILSTGRGNCYCFASVFWYLSRWIGYDAKIFSGGVLGGPHSWVEIGGYIYDTQLEWRYVHDWGYTGYLWNFYHLQDSTDTFRYRK